MSLRVIITFFSSTPMPESFIVSYHCREILYKANQRGSGDLTTLGPYSFRSLVDCAYTPKRLEGKLFRGRRPTITVGKGQRKRPRGRTIKLRLPCLTRPKPVTHLLVKDLLKRQIDRRRAVQQNWGGKGGR